MFLRGFAWLLAVMLKIFLIYVAIRWAEKRKKIGRTGEVKASVCTFTHTET